MAGVLPGHWSRLRTDAHFCKAVCEFIVSEDKEIGGPLYSITVDYRLSRWQRIREIVSATPFIQALKQDFWEQFSAQDYHEPRSLEVYMISLYRRLSYEEVLAEFRRREIIPADADEAIAFSRIHTHPSYTPYYVLGACPRLRTSCLSFGWSLDRRHYLPSLWDIDHFLGDAKFLVKRAS